MTVKDIVKSACVLLGREDIAEYLNGKTENIGAETIPALSIMVALTNLVIGELAGTFIPMSKTERVMVKDNKVYYKKIMWHQHKH